MITVDETTEAVTNNYDATNMASITSYYESSNSI
jgi:hypothetical protein